MGGLFFNDLPGHFADHAAMGLVSGNNPFSVTLEQAITAGDTATSTPIFNGGINYTGAAEFTFSSDAGGGGGAGFYHKLTNAVEPANHTKWYNRDDTILMTLRRIVGDNTLYMNNDIDDIQIHEKQTQVDPTGAWNPTGTWDYTGGTLVVNNLDIFPTATKGNLIAGTGSAWGYRTSTTDGSVMISDSGQSTGLGWVTTAGSTSGDVLTTNGSGVAPTWQAGGGALLATANTWTAVNTFDEGIVVGDNTSTQSHLSLHGLTAGLPGVKRGGSIEWEQNSGAVAGYTYVDSTDRVVFNTAAQAGASDAGNAWINFSGNASFSDLASYTMADSATISMGAGADLVIQHDGTDNEFVSNLAVTTTDIHGFKFVHDTDVTSTVDESTGNSRLGPAYNEGSAVGEFAVRINGGSEYPFAWLTAAARTNRGLGTHLPGLTLLCHDNASGYPWDKGWSLGAINVSDSNFSGMHTTSETKFDCWADGTKVCGFDKSTGLIVGPSSSVGIVGTSSGSYLNLRAQTPTASVPWVIVNTQSKQEGSGATNRSFAVHHNVTGYNYPLFTCWPGSQGAASYGTPQVAVHADGQLCFDASNASNGTTRGDTYFVYDSGASTADFFCDGTEMWNSDGTDTNFVGGLVVPVKADATRGAAGTAGRVIFNTDDGELNVDDGTNWTLVSTGATT